MLFTADAEGVLRGRIEHYLTSVVALVVTFGVVAAKITVNGTEQISGQKSNDFTNPVIYRLYADDGSCKEFTVRSETGSATGFPIVAIATDGGKPVVSRDEWIGGQMKIDPQESDYEALSCAIEIKGRGHNSWRVDKKPYAIKLTEKSPVMGMPKQKRWVLLDNASDRTLLRNRVAYEIGRRIELDWTPDNRFMEVILNRTYLGSYLLCEQIRIDENRVNITEMEAGDNEGEELTEGVFARIGSLL